MKKKLITCLSISALLAGGLSAALFFGDKKTEEVEGYSTSSLPTTIDLNDSTEAQIRSYYSSLNSKTQDERQGTNLLKNLKTILKTGQKYFSYDSGNAIWQIYEIADRDWDKSPASSTTYGTYNSTTKKITNYVYGTSASNSKNNPYIHALYINRNVSNQVTAWDDHQQTQWGINREHVWPKAEGFETAGEGGARGDPMHLMAGNGYANNIHSNYYYGYVNKSSSYTDCGSKYSNVSGNLLGKSKTLGGSIKVFEPQDSDKGDIARAIFYMVARYNYYSGSDSDGINSNNPNLSLTQSLSDWSQTAFESSTSKKGYMGVMTDLLAWHHADPVDEFEIHRNNLLYKNYTNNRNPFIDFPEWADFIWGSVDYSGSTYKSHSTTPTGYATPSNDTINGYNQSGTVNVTGVALNKGTLTIAKNGTATLVETVSPANASNKNVTWSTSNNSIASVDSSGVVTGKAKGTATITVTTADGGLTANCEVTVYDDLQSITVSGQTTNFKVGDNFVFGGIVTANYTDSFEDVTESASFTGYNMSITGEQTVTVSYGGKSTIYTITISNSSSGGEVTGSITASGGEFSGWTKSGTGSYTDNSAKFDTSGDYVYKLDIFDEADSAYMTNLKVTINGKWNPGTASGDNNSYKVEAISGTADNVIVKDSVTKTGEDVFNTSYGDVDFEMSTSLSGTTGIRITYVNKASGNLAVKSISWVATFALPTSITAELNESKVFYVNETITQDDFTVTTDLGQDVTSSIAFDDYQFTYEDAPSGGTTADKNFPIIFGDLETVLIVQVKREAFAGELTDVLNSNYTGVTSTYYESWGPKAAPTTEAYYFGHNAGKGTTIQLRATATNNDYYTNTYSGIVSTVSGGTIKSVSVEWDTTQTTSIRTLNIYGKNSPYSSANDLYSDEVSDYGALLGTIVLGTSTSLNISGSYKYIGIRSAEYTQYLKNITITYNFPNTALNVANYIMFEDNENQCTTKTDVAIGYYNKLLDSEKSNFLSSDDYVISTARERFMAWLSHEGKTIGEDNIIKGTKVINLINDTNYSSIIIIAISTCGVMSLGGYFLFKRKKGR